MDERVTEIEDPKGQHDWRLMGLTGSCAHHEAEGIGEAHHPFADWSKSAARPVFIGPGQPAPRRSALSMQTTCSPLASSNRA